MDLNAIMEFDHVITVDHDGNVTDGPSWLYAPNLLDGELDSPQWTMLNGYSGQYRYSGPVMHNSESIRGDLADHILETPGHYVAIVANYSPEDPDAELDTEGWAVARYCGHVWRSGAIGSMYVHPEDIATVVEAGQRVECDLCEYVPVAGRDY